MTAPPAPGRCGRGKELILSDALAAARLPPPMEGESPLSILPPAVAHAPAHPCSLGNGGASTGEAVAATTKCRPRTHSPPEDLTSSGVGQGGSSRGLQLPRRWHPRSGCHPGGAWSRKRQQGQRPPSSGRQAAERTPPRYGRTCGRMEVHDGGTSGARQCRHRGACIVHLQSDEKEGPPRSAPLWVSGAGQGGTAQACPRGAGDDKVGT